MRDGPGGTALRRGARRAMAWAALVGLAACDGGIAGAPLEHTVTAAVRGVVADPEGIGVEGTRVEVFVYRATACDAGAETPALLSVTSTDAAGAFGGLLVLPLVEPFEGCLDLVATPPDSTGLAPGGVGGVRVAFTTADAPPDTAVVEVGLLP